MMLMAGTIVDATIIASPSSTKNKEGARDRAVKVSKFPHVYMRLAL